jgi:adenylate cyclase
MTAPTSRGNSTQDSAPWPEPQRARRTLVVGDVVESVRLMQAHEADVIDRWRRLVHEVQTQVLPQYGGRLVKSLGDGFLMEFENVSPAVAAALDIQRRVPAYNAGCAADAAMYLRVGAHVADVVMDELDVYGVGVNLAARLAGLAGPGEIVISAGVRQQLTEGLDAEFEDLGECYLRNVQAPVRAYRVGPAGPLPVVAMASANPAHSLLPSIAVIPFALRMGAAADALLGEVIADDITAGLARTRRLRVTSRLSATAFRDRQATAASIGSVLGVAYVLTGAVSVHGEQVMVHVELTDARDGTVLWLESLRTAVAALFSAEGDLVAQVVAQVGTAILACELQRASAVSMPSLASYTLLLGAVTLMHRCINKEEFTRAHDLFDQLAERHRRHSVPHAWLAKWHLLNVVQGWSDDPGVDAQRALDRSRRALDLDGRDSLALTIDGQLRGFLNKDLAGAEARHQEALAINPSEPMAWLHLANVRCWRGEGGFAEEATRKAIELSPLDPMKPYFEFIAAHACLAAEQYERAIGFAQRSLRGHRTHTATHRVLAIAQVLSGDLAGARATVAEMHALEPQLTVTRFRARYPGAEYPHAERYAQSLAEAGLPP